MSTRFVTAVLSAFTLCLSAISWAGAPQPDPMPLPKPVLLNQHQPPLPLPNLQKVVVQPQQQVSVPLPLPVPHKLRNRVLHAPSYRQGVCQGLDLIKARAVRIMSPVTGRQGSGVLVDETYVLTALHVVDGSRMLKVVTLNEDLTATVVAVNKEADLALLRLPYPIPRVDSLVLAPKVPEIGDAYQAWSPWEESGKGLAVSGQVRMLTFSLAGLEVITPTGVKDVESPIKSYTQYRVSYAGMWGVSGNAIFDCSGRLSGIVNGLANTALPKDVWNEILRTKDRKKVLENRRVLQNQVARPEAIRSFLCGKGIQPLPGPCRNGS